MVPAALLLLTVVLMYCRSAAHGLLGRDILESAVTRFIWMISRAEISVRLVQSVQRLNAAECVQYCKIGLKTQCHLSRAPWCWRQKLPKFRDRDHASDLDCVSTSTLEAPLLLNIQFSFKRHQAWAPTWTWSQSCLRLSLRLPSWPTWTGRSSLVVMISIS